MGELEVFIWRGEGTREASEPLPVPKGDKQSWRGTGQGMESHGYTWDNSVADLRLLGVL